jgi:uncharacterized membrane protein YedE/YeeE
MMLNSRRKKMKNWKTTAAGIASFLAVVSTQLQYYWDANPSTTPDWNLVAGAAFVLWGLVMAKDASEKGQS